MLHIKQVSITPPYKRGFLASAIVTLRDDDGSEITISNFTLNRNDRGSIYITSPTHGFKTDMGWSYVHILQFSPELWSEIESAIRSAWQRHQATQAKQQSQPPLTPRYPDKQDSEVEK